MPGLLTDPGQHHDRQVSGPAAPDRLAARSSGPLRTGKGYLYEGGIRVPFIVKWPGGAKAATVSDVSVSSIDFFPTILEIAEAKAEARQGIDGVSLVPLLKQSGQPNREVVYWHYPHYPNQGGKPGGAVHQGDFKLIEFYEDVLRATEQVLMPERGATLGNFGATPVTERESWVTDAEGVWNDAARQRGAKGATFLARVLWSRPNRLVPAAN